MDQLVAAWLNVQWMVYNWFAQWWATVDGNVHFLQRIGD